MNNVVVCPPTFPIRSFTGVCYFRSSSKASWDNAISSCRSMGGMLAEPKNVQEHQTLHQSITWIGINKVSQGRWNNFITMRFLLFINKNFSWVYASTNSPIIYLPELRNPASTKKCMLTYDSSRWEPSYCHHSYHYYCQYIPPPPPPPPPTTKKPAYGYEAYKDYYSTYGYYGWSCTFRLRFDLTWMLSVFTSHIII